MARLYHFSRCIHLHVKSPKLNSAKSSNFPNRLFEVDIPQNGLRNIVYARNYASDFKNNQNNSFAASLNRKNIFKSKVPDIPDIQDMFLHEYIWSKASNWWNKTAAVCAMTGKSYTYEQLRKLSGRFASSLRRNNICPGETIAVVLPNVIEYAIVILAASEAGVQVTKINPMYTATEISKQLINSDAVAVITFSQKVPVVTESISGNSAIRLPVIVIGDKSASTPEGTINFDDLIADHVEEFEKIGLKTERDPNNDTFFIPFSSGTTGLPKGVELTHRNLVTNIRQLRPEEISVFREASSEHQEIVPLILPIFHAAGFTGCLFVPLSFGSKIIFMPQFSSQQLLNLLQEYKATLLLVVPPILNLMAHDERFGPQLMENIKHVCSGAAPMGEELIQKFLSRCGNHFYCTQGYGITETSPMVTFGFKSPYASSSQIVPNTEIRIVGYGEANESKNLGIDEVGQIYVRGPQVMKGYLKNSQATQEVMEEDWFKTGDIGRVDAEGYLYVHERLKELIKVQGMQVAPAELEDILQGHHKVADVAVIGVPDERYGEVPKAFIVPKPNMIIDPQEIKDHVAKQVVNYKQLGHVVLIDKIPKVAGGKVLRRELKKFE